MTSSALGREIRFRHLGSPEEFHEAEALQIAAWGMTEEHPVPHPLQRAMADNGGLLLGAFRGSQLAGFCLGFLGRDQGRLFHYSHMTAVRPEFQNQHLGYRLKLYQREEVLKQDLTEIRWTYDPLQSRNAFLNVRRLGARPRAYHAQYYGSMGSEINRGLETDRLAVSWELTAPTVTDRVQGRYPTKEQDRARWHGSQALVETETDRSEVRVPTGGSAPSSPHVTIEIPADLSLIRDRRPDAVVAWREATRRAFLTCFEAGYRVDDFAVLSDRGGPRSFYFLSLGPSPGRVPPGPPREAR